MFVSNKSSALTTRWYVLLTQYILVYMNHSTHILEKFKTHDDKF